MTPTLMGRWQTRLLLLASAGVLISILFGLLYADLWTPLTLLGWVLVLGLAWDVLYEYLQGWRWDGDWPPLFALAAGAFEGLVIWALIGVPGLPGVDPGLPAGQFAAHYGMVLLVTWVLAHGPIKVLFPRWRYLGGRIW